MIPETIVQQTKLIDGWFLLHQMETLYPYVKKLESGALLIEVGTYKGRSTMFFSQSNPDISIITIDNRDLIDPRVIDRPNVVQLIADSWETGDSWQSPIDFLFIDGHHAYENVKADIEAWYPHLKEGGIIVFHDYYWQEDFNPEEGVKQAVDEWSHNCDIILADPTLQLFIGRKPHG